MKDWVLSDSGDQWSVKFDVRDLGGHLDTTFRGWSSTLAVRVRLVISRLVLIFILPLDFHGRVRVVRSMYLACLLCMVLNLLCWLLTVCGSFGPLSAEWSGHNVNLWLVLGLCLVCLMGLLGVTPLFVWFGSGFGSGFGWYLSLWPAEAGRVYRLLGMVSHGCPGHGPVHLLFASAAEVGFWLDPVALARSRPGLPLLSNLAGPVQHFRAAILDVWRCRVAAGLCGKAGFRGGPLFWFSWFFAAP